MATGWMFVGGALLGVGLLLAGCGSSPSGSEADSQVEPDGADTGDVDTAAQPDAEPDGLDSGSEDADSLGDTPEPDVPDEDTDLGVDTDVAVDVADTDADVEPPSCTPGQGFEHVLLEWKPEGASDPSLNFFSPIDLKFAPDGRGFLLQKDGTVWILRDGQLDPEPFVRVPDTSDAWIETGLLGVALDPDFETTPWIYLFQTYVTTPGAQAVPGTCPDEEGGKLDCPFALAPNPEEPGTFLVENPAEGPKPFGNSRQRVIRYWAENDTVDDANDFQVLLDELPGGTSTHNGGGLVFGLDGALFVGLGDSAVDSASKDPATYPGTVLRIDKETGEAWPTNPFIGPNDGKLDRVYAYGIRQGFNLVIHPESGELYQAENGPTIDEFNWIPMGANMGWNVGAGPIVDDPDELYTDPLFTWPIAVGPTKSLIYQGEEFPELVGSILVGTWNNQGILRIDLPDPVNAPHDQVVVSTFYPNFDIKPVMVSADAQGRIYYSSALEAKLFRIERPGDCTPPTASLVASATTGPTPLTVEFDASASVANSPASTISSYEWRFDDGETAEGPTVSRTFEPTRPHVVELVVTDDLGQTSTTTQSILVTAGLGNGFPSSHIVSAGPLVGPVPHEVNFMGHGHDEENALVELRWDWGDGQPDYIIPGPADSEDFEINHTFALPGTYEVVLSVTDAVGQSISTSVTVFAQ